MEMTVLEPLRCPGCSTRFVLGAARVRPGLRRAKCFRCASVFPIEEAVARLLAPVPELPEPEPQAPPLLPEELQVHDAFPVRPVEPGEPADPPQAATGAGYASAKDAIASLMGSAPAPPAPARLGSRGTMDVEATLDALSSTLGAAPAAPPKSDLSSTVKLTSEEIKAAMGEQARMPALPVPPRPAPSADIQPPAPAEPLPDQGTDLLKIQLEQETCNNVTVDQMAAWIEQGRVLEYHMVARQFSEHWIEASRVPALRPAFDRVRRIRETQAEEAPRPAPEAPPAKRGLFSGLFGRN